MKPLVIVFAAVLHLAAAGCEANKPEAPGPTDQATPSQSAAPAPSTKEPRRVAVTVTGSGYEPGSIEARAGEPLTLVFKRTTDQGCGNQLVFPDRDLRRDLPLNQEVEVGLTPGQDETIAFTCGMGMYRGSVVATTR